MPNLRVKPEDYSEMTNSRLTTVGYYQICSHILRGEKTNDS